MVLFSRVLIREGCSMEITINREIGKLGLPRHLVLGMDPGIASCGFALIDTANHESWIWASDI